MIELTQGICLRLHNAKPEDAEMFNGSYTVQFLSIKKVHSAIPNSIDRYRIIVSDGVHFIQAMLATQLNSMINDQTVTKHTVAVIEKLTCNYVQQKKLYIILALRVISNDEGKIGEPLALQEAGPPPQDTGTTASAPQQPSPNVSSNPPPPQAFPSHNAPSNARPARGPIFPIEGLSPYQNNWTIKARVTQKSEMKQWSNARGEGKLFNVTLMDETGEIRATAFNLVAEDLYTRLEEGKVYYVSKARVTLAKKKFSNLPGDYELGLERNTEIEECHEVANLPMIKYRFVSLSGLEELAKDAVCDVIAVVKETSPLSEVHLKQQNKAVNKRELVLVDQSGYSVRMTLWGKQAEQYTSDDNPVVAFKGARVGDFGGRSLSMLSSSTMTMNPDIEECFALRGWYDAIGSGQSFQAQSSSPGGSSGVTFKRSEALSINEVREAQLGQHDKAEYFSTRATIVHIKADNLSYPGCPNCNKKVVDMNDGTWRCDKCEKGFPAPEHRYLVSLAVADWSGQAWLQGFNEVGITIFGMSANELLQIKENDESKFNAILHKANCSTFNFSCRAKQEEYNGTARTRYGISYIGSLNYKEEAKALVEVLNSPWAH